MDDKTRERWMAARYKHGGYAGGIEHPEHYIWRTMIARCNNPKAKHYRLYGGRGITVCRRWLVYKNFLYDIGHRPSSGHSLDRIDNNKGYKPSNCRWATRSQQQKNKSTTRMYSDGVFTGTLVECAVYVGISKELAHWRWKTHNTFKKGESWRELQRAQ